jgi:hypothetical protein
MGILGAPQNRLGRDPRGGRDARAEFLESPVGQARTSFERGDLVLQLELDFANQRPAIIPAMGAEAHTAGAEVHTTTDPTEILNAVCREGWDLLSASMIPLDAGPSRATGSGRGKGQAVGYYTFRRCPQHRTLHAPQ